MYAINIKQIAKDAIGFGDLPDDCCNFGHVNVRAKPAKLTQVMKSSKPMKTSTTKVSFAKPKGRINPESLAMIRVSANRGFMDRVFLQQGVLTGLDPDKTQIQIALGHLGLQQFGHTMTLDLSQPLCYENTWEEQTYISQEKNISNKSSADVSYTLEKSKAFFQFDVVVNGRVTFRNAQGVYEVTIAGAVSKLKLEGNPSVESLTVTNEGVTLTVKGEMEFRRPSDPVIDW